LYETVGWASWLNPYLEAARLGANDIAQACALKYFRAVGRPYGVRAGPLQHLRQGKGGAECAGAAHAKALALGEGRALLDQHVQGSPCQQEFDGAARGVGFRRTPVVGRRGW
jgi:hypothetical protein